MYFNVKANFNTYTLNTRYIIDYRKELLMKYLCAVSDKSSGIITTEN